MLGVNINTPPPEQLRILSVFATKTNKYSAKAPNEWTHRIDYPPLSVHLIFKSVTSSRGRSGVHITIGHIF